jgi:hypothetical protein
MPSYETVRIQISKLDGYDQVITRKEIKELPNILWDDENIHHVISGTYNHGQGLLIATEIRLLFVDKGMLGKLKVEDFPLDKISSIQYETGMMFGKITIFTSSNKAAIEQVEKNSARAFAEMCRRMISKQERNDTRHNPENEQGGVSENASISELERLAKLYSDGVLTDEEFSKAKQKLIG